MLLTKAHNLKLKRFCLNCVDCSALKDDYRSTIVHSVLSMQKAPQLLDSLQRLEQMAVPSSSATLTFIQVQKMYKILGIYFPKGFFPSGNFPREFSPSKGFPTTVKTKKLQNRMTTLKQEGSAFDVVLKQIALLVSY